MPTLYLDRDTERPRIPTRVNVGTAVTQITLMSGLLSPALGGAHGNPYVQTEGAVSFQRSHLGQFPVVDVTTWQEFAPAQESGEEIEIDQCYISRAAAAANRLPDEGASAEDMQALTAISTVASFTLELDDIEE